MSTLKTTVIQNPSSGTANITLGTSGQVTFGGAVTGSGMDLINTTTFSAVSSVSLNNCFTNAYENYLLNITLSDASAAYPQLRLRASGTDLTTNTYTYQEFYAGGTSTSVGNSGATSFYRFGYAGADGSAFIMNVFKPQLAAVKFFSTRGIRNDGSLGQFTDFTAVNTTANAYDGFTLFNNSSVNMTGTVRVYGLKNS